MYPVKQPRAAAFWLVAMANALLLFASSAPSPLYVIYQSEWGFSSAALTFIFAVYVLFLLAMLVFTGALSDHIGRRPVLVLALVVQLASMVMFAEATGVGWLVGARIVQGIATGMATAAANATLLDLQPAERPRLGALVASVSSSGGLAAGALGSGLLVAFAPAPKQLVYWLLAGLFLFCVACLARLPATGHPDGRLWQGLVPRLAVPAPARPLFLSITPCLLALWALSGLYLSLGPSICSSVMGVRSPLVGGSLIAVLTGVGALTSVLTGRWPAGRGLLTGTAILSLGVIVVLVSLALASLPILFLGTLCAGIGFGPAFTGAFKALTALAAPDERSGLVAAIYVICYLGLSLPAIAAGIAARTAGLTTTTRVYGLAVIVLAVSSAAACLPRRRLAE